MARILALALIPLTAGCATASLDQWRLVDLTHTLDRQTIFWPTESGFERQERHAGLTAKGFYYAAGSFCSPEHGGTHIDAPIHFHEGRDTVEQIPLSRLVGPGAVVDVTAACAADRDYQVTIEDLLGWEAQHGLSLTGRIIFLKTGYGRFWPDRVQYMGTDERGEEAVAKLHFPGLHPDAARWIAEQRTVKAVGLDTPSIDYGQSTHFQSHVTLFTHNIPAFENVANLEQLPGHGFEVVALPMKIGGGSGGPIRIVAFLRN
jgi:kynurenine formamidase